jgi:ABC-2 type transport system permease protein
MLRWDKVQVWKILLLIFPALLGVGFVLGITVMVSEFAPLVNEHDLLVEFLTYAIFLSMFVVFVLAVIPTIIHLYLGKDTEFFASLPIGGSAVYFAKLAIVYIMQLLLAIVLMVPVFVTTGAVLGLGPLYYTMMLAVILAMPALPLLAMSILAIPIMYMVSFFRNRGALTSIFLIVFIGAGYAVYFAVLASNSSSSTLPEGTPPTEVPDFDAELAAFLRSTSGLLNVFAPLVALIRIACGQNATLFGEMDTLNANIVNVCIFVVSLVVVCIVVRIISGTIYMRGARAQLESQKINLLIKSRDTNRSHFGALMYKEIKELLRTPSFAMNYLYMIVMSPIAVLFFANHFVNLDSLTGAVQYTQVLDLVLIMFVLITGVGVNTGANTTISREGDKFYLLKILPVDYKTQVRAKLTVYHTISLITIVLSLVCFVVVKGSYLTALAGFVFLLMYSRAYVRLAAIFDLSRPKLKWSTPRELLKNNSNVYIPMLLSMASIFVLIGFAIVWLIVGIKVRLQSIVIEIVLWVVLYIVSGGFMLLFGKMLNSKSVKYLERIEV